MKVTKTIRPSDLAYELQLIPMKAAEASRIALRLPWMVAAAKSLCPIHTGALMNSIRSEPRGQFSSALIAGGARYVNPLTGKSVDYARHVHDGTSRMPSRPFLFQAVIQERLRVAREIIRETLEGLGV